MNRRMSNKRAKPIHCSNLNKRDNPNIRSKHNNPNNPVQRGGRAQEANRGAQEQVFETGRG